MYHGNFSFSMPKPYQSVESRKKFPEDIQCIQKSKNQDCGSLYISNIQAAENINTLKKLRIGAVLSCAKGYQLKHPVSAIPHYKYIPTVDHDQCDISGHFEHAADFIRDKLMQTNVLVHCIAGVSRSVSMVLAYYIREHNMTYDEAYRLVKSKRKIISPNDGFVRQLKRYEQTKKSLTPQKKRDTTPQPSTQQTGNHYQVGSPSKLNDYPHLGITHFKSTQLMADKKVQSSSFKKYDSNQLTPKKDTQKERKEGYAYNGIKQDRYYEKYGIYRTATGFLTPNKMEYGRRVQQYTNNDQIKTVSVNRQQPTPQSTINAQATFTPKADKSKIRATPPTQQPASVNQTNPVVKEVAEVSRKGCNFAEMNRELNDKIEIIRKKYEDQRNKLYEKYQTPLRNYHHDDKHHLQNTTVDRFYNTRGYDTVQAIKRNSVTIDRNATRRYDFSPHQVGVQTKDNLYGGRKPQCQQYQDLYNRKLQSYNHGYGKYEQNARDGKLLGRYDQLLGRKFQNNYLQRYPYDYNSRSKRL